MRLSGIILVSCLHFRASLRGAKFGYRAIEQVDLVVEVDDYTLNRMFISVILSPKFKFTAHIKKSLTVHREPFIQVLALRKLDGLAQTATSQGGLGKLPQLVTTCALGGGSGLEGGSRPCIAGRG